MLGLKKRCHSHIAIERAYSTMLMPQAHNRRILFLSILCACFYIRSVLLFQPSVYIPYVSYISGFVDYLRMTHQVVGINLMYSTYFLFREPKELAFLNSIPYKNEKTVQCHLVVSPHCFCAIHRCIVPTFFLFQ